MYSVMCSLSHKNGKLFFTYGLVSNRSDESPVFYAYQDKTFCEYECVSNKWTLGIVETLFSWILLKSTIICTVFQMQQAWEGRLMH